MSELTLNLSTQIDVPSLKQSFLELTRLIDLFPEQRLEFKKLLKEKADLLTIGESAMTVDGSLSVPIVLNPAVDAFIKNLQQIEVQRG